MGFREAVESGKFLITAEVGPGKGTDMHELLEDAEAIKDRIHAINVTDLQSSVMRLGSLAVSHILADKGIEPIYQLTCRDRNRLALQSDLLSAWVLGVKNVLALTGDHPVLGDHPEAMPVFDCDSVSLLNMMQTLNGGHDMAGNELNGVPDFFPGAVVNPGADAGAGLEMQLIKLEKKIEAGARFIQTQGVFELDSFEKFMKRVEGFNVPVMGGIIMLKSAGMAKFMNKNVAGISVPESQIKAMTDTDDKVKTSVEIASHLVKGMKDMCHGVHIMAIGWEKKIPMVLDEAGL